MICNGVINMKNLKKLCIFVILSLVLFTLFATVAFAAEANDVTAMSNKLDMNMKPESFAERAEFALQGTVTGMIMVFAVLGLLAIIMSLSKIVFHDIPNKKKERSKKETEIQRGVSATHAQAAPVEAPASAPQATDDGELVAVITAAIAAMIESGEYKDEFAGGFRVVSFKRSTSKAWNRK